MQARKVFFVRLSRDGKEIEKGLIENTTMVDLNQPKFQYNENSQQYDMSIWIDIENEEEALMRANNERLRLRDKWKWQQS